MRVDVAIQSSDELAIATSLVRTAMSRDAVRATCFIAGAANASISITWISDDEIARMNWQYLGHKGVTDVISFHLYDDGDDPVGDIYIGYQQAARQAESLGVTLEVELVRLAVHGTLHVLGFDHPEGEARMKSEMWTLQEAIVDEVTALTSHK